MLDLMKRVKGKLTMWRQVSVQQIPNNLARISACRTAARSPLSPSSISTSSRSSDPPGRNPKPKSSAENIAADGVSFPQLSLLIAIKFRVSVADKALKVAISFTVRRLAIGFPVEPLLFPAYDKISRGTISRTVDSKDD